MLNVARLALATVAIVAMTYQFAATADSDFQKASFFSFFTIQANLLAVTALFGLVLVSRARRTSAFERHRLPRAAVAAWLAFPLAWIGYTLVRGVSVDWYPYPFVDVSRLGYDGVLVRAVVLAVGFAFAGAALLWLGNRRARS